MKAKNTTKKKHETSERKSTVAVFMDSAKCFESKTDLYFIEMNMADYFHHYYTIHFNETHPFSKKFISTLSKEQLNNFVDFIFSVESNNMYNCQSIHMHPDCNMHPKAIGEILIDKFHKDLSMKLM